MDAGEIAGWFRTPEGNYAFARWNRPLAPVIFGVEESSLPVLKGAIEAVARLAGLEVAETDPELGVNLMTFFVRDWAELDATPNLDRLVPDLAGLVPRLQAAEAAQYRFFRYDSDGAIKVACLFVRMTTEVAAMPAEAIALTNAVQTIVTWGPGAFAEASPLAVHPETGAIILRPEVAAVIAAAYDPAIPVAADDASHALRLAARLADGSRA